MNDEIWKYMTKSEREIQCCFCGKVFNVKYTGLWRHLTDLHNFKKESKSQKEVKTDCTSYRQKVSSLCWEYFEKVNVSKKATCKLCQAQITFLRFGSFSPHNMIGHLKSVHLLLGGGNHLCTHCGKQFYQRARKIACEARHNGELKNQCNYEGCSSQFSYRQRLKRHISAVHKKMKPHICEQCGRGFAQATQLKTHSRVHTGETPFACEKCMKKFKFQASKNSHKCVSP